MSIMNNIMIKRLKMMVYRSISCTLELNKPSKLHPILQQNADIKIAVGTCLLHSQSIKNTFYKYVRKHKHVKDGADRFSHSHVIEVLQKCQSVSEQLNVFHSLVELSAEEVDQRYNVCSEIKGILKAVLPSASLNIIGSSATGLGLKGCDLDLSFQSNDSEGHNSSMADQVIVMTKDIKDGKIPASTFPKLNMKQKLHFLNKVLRDSDICGAVIPGRFPILNFSYKGFNVDLSINNIFGLQGTTLMKLCASIDSRVAPLFRCISYWAKHHKLCGGTMKFKSYGLFLLVVFFLQSKRILPPVQSILEKTEFQTNQDIWLLNACSFINRIEKSENSQLTEELLQEFFFFYMNLDFSYVICPLTYKLVQGPVFLKESTNGNFELNSISTQDPLQPDLNVTGRVGWKHCRYFATELLSVCEIILQQWKPSSENWGFLSLIDKDPHPKDLINIRNIELDIPVISLHESRFMAQKLHKILNYCLKFECRLKTDEHKQNEGEREVLVSRFTCSSTNTWLGRSNYESMKNDSVSACYFEVQRDISEQMLQCISEKKSDFVLLCECKYCDKNLNVTITPVSSKVFIPKLAIFLKYYILKYMNS